MLFEFDKDEVLAHLRGELEDVRHTYDEYADSGGSSVDGIATLGKRLRRLSDKVRALENAETNTVLLNEEEFNRIF